jgi:chromosome segregation ATPase
MGALRVPSLPDATALASPKAAGSEQQGAAAAPAAGSAQRVEVLQQQLKVTEAFRTSLEGELRDARFANTNLQTQMLSLQTKFEKTVEQQLAEVERLIKLRREGQDAHEQAIQQVHTLKHQLELQGQATASAQREAQAAAKHAAEQEQRTQQAEAEATHVREELAGCTAELEQKRGECSALAEQLQAVQQRAQSADVRVLQLQAMAQQADEAHRAAMKQVGLA